jgi:branched-chain amino acid transport system substrate-binding protein
MLQSANELGLKPRMMGGGMVGLQYTAIKSKLKSKLNGIVNYKTWVPSAKLISGRGLLQEIPGARARHRSARLLPGWLGICLSAGARRRDHGIEEHQRRQDRRLSPHSRVQHHHGVRHQVRQKRRMDQIRNAAGPSYQTVLTPAEEKTGSIIYPYEKALG